MWRSGGDRMDLRIRAVELDPRIGGAIRIDMRGPDSKAYPPMIGTYALETRCVFTPFSMLVGDAARYFVTMFARMPSVAVEYRPEA